MVQTADFDPAVPLPPGLDTHAIRRAIDYIEKERGDLVALYFEQANVFSAVVGIFGTKALHQYSQFEKNKHWKYEGSTAGTAGGGRTHTFGVKAPAKKLGGAAVYKRKDIIVRGGKPIPANGQDQT